MAVLAIAGGVAIFLVASRPIDPLRAKPRKDWKETAIADIERRAADTNWLQSEIRTVTAQIAQDRSSEGTWVSQGLLLFKNGEWLVFTNKCSKEDPRIRDIFIARGSDGQWRYSTYHFCNRMISLMPEEQPDSLSDFDGRFFARRFDGRSDECLKKTWR